MPDTQPRRFQCRHIFTDGHRCGSPCLRGEEFCFYHHTARARRAIPTRGAIETIDLSQGEHQKSPFTLPALEDRSAIQHAIGEVLNRLAANQLDPRRAGLLLYGLQIASLNLPQPAPAKPAQETSLVEEVIAHPDLGPIAPPTELLPPGANGKPSTLTELLLQELRRNAPSLPPNPTHLTQPIPPPEPTILDDLTAAEGSTTSEASTTAAPPSCVISTEAQRSGETCGSHRYRRPLQTGALSTEGRPKVSRSGETCSLPCCAHLSRCTPAPPSGSHSLNDTRRIINHATFEPATRANCPDRHTAAALAARGLVEAGSGTHPYPTRFDRIL